MRVVPVSRPWSSAADRASASPPPRPLPFGGQVVTRMGRSIFVRRSASLTTRWYVSRAAKPSTAISVAPTSTARSTAALAHWSDVIGAD